MQIYNNTWATFDCNVQIEQGNKATEYEPYKENNITFYINEPLRGTGTTKDRVYVKDDKVIVQRNCGGVTLDGSDDENWEMSSYTNTNTKIYTTRRGLEDLMPSSSVVSSNDSFITKVNSQWPEDFEGLWTNNRVNTNAGMYPQLNIRILKIKLQTQDVVGFKQWLAQNPVTVVYQLLEPTYEEVEYNDTKLFIESFKNSTLFYNSNVPVTSKLYYSYSVPIVDTVAQTANVTDQQDSMIIDLATQCAVMEMMLM